MNDTNFDASASHLKFVMLGDHGVGKSALAQRFAMDGFPVQYKETVGMDMYRNTVFLPGMVMSCVAA